ncbi:MAG: hypothetical protein LBS32_07615 [Clostridiales Family XIII bacterium]|jgi:hypothetical protein|nr:hypothetical protein [Clostridiales Family XIII bacterium]
MLAKEAIYRAVYGYLVSEDGKESVDAAISGWDGADALGEGRAALTGLCARLREDMAEEAAGKAGREGALRAMKAVIKNARGDAFRGAFMHGGMQCVSDGYRAICLREPLGLPEAGGAPAIGDAVEGARLGCTRPLELPGIGELAASVALHRAEMKARHGKRWASFPASHDFGEGGPLVNAQYLLDIMGALPDASAAWDGLHTVLFEAAAGEAVLMACPRPQEG